MRAVPPVKENYRDVSIEGESGTAPCHREGSGSAARDQQAGELLKRIENVRFMDSPGSEYSYEGCRSGFSVMAVACAERDCPDGL